MQCPVDSWYPPTVIWGSSPTHARTWNLETHQTAAYTHPMTSKSALGLQWEAVLCRQWKRNSFCYCFSYSISIAVLFLVPDHRLKHPLPVLTSDLICIKTELHLSIGWDANSSFPDSLNVNFSLSRGEPREQDLTGKVTQSGPLITSHLHRSGCR